MYPMRNAARIGIGLVLLSVAFSLAGDHSVGGGHGVMPLVRVLAELFLFSGGLGAIYAGVKGFIRRQPQ